MLSKNEKCVEGLCCRCFLQLGIIHLHLVTSYLMKYQRKGHKPVGVLMVFLRSLFNTNGLNFADFRDLYFNCKQQQQ